MRGDDTNHQEKVGHKIIFCVCQYAIIYTAGKNSDLVCDGANMRSSKLHQASRAPDFPYLLVLLTLFLSSSPITLFPIHNSIIIAEHKVKSSHSITSSYNHGLIPDTAYTE
jgi:hypothetical protein